MSTQGIPIRERQALLSALDFQLPTGYLEFIFSSNIIYDSHSYSYLEQNGYCLYAAVDLLETNLGYNAAECYPGYFLIGSNGGGEAFAIQKATGYFVATPFIGHDEESPITIGQTWPEFFRRLQADTIFEAND